MNYILIAVISQEAHFNSVTNVSMMLVMFEFSLLSITLIILTIPGTITIFDILHFLDEIADSI